MRKEIAIFAIGFILVDETHGRYRGPDHAHIEHHFREPVTAAQSMIPVLLPRCRVALIFSQAWAYQ